MVMRGLISRRRIWFPAFAGMAAGCSLPVEMSWLFWRKQCRRWGEVSAFPARSYPITSKRCSTRRSLSPNSRPCDRERNFGAAPGAGKSSGIACLPCHSGSPGIQIPCGAPTSCPLSFPGNLGIRVRGWRYFLARRMPGRGDLNPSLPTRPSRAACARIPVGHVFPNPPAPVFLHRAGNSSP